MRVFLIITLFALSLFALVVLFCAVLMLWTIEPFAGILGAFSLLVSLVLIALEALDKKSNY